MLIILHVFSHGSYNNLTKKWCYFHFTDEENNIPKTKSYRKWLSLELSSGISEYKAIQLFIVTY